MSNFLSLIKQDGGTFYRVASTGDGEYAGPCPWCHGKDRFIIHPHDGRGRYFCRGCGRHGDVIDYLREYRGLSYREALTVIDTSRPDGLHAYGTARQERKVVSPFDTWRKSAEKLLQDAQRNLENIADDPDDIDYDGFKDNDGTILSSCRAFLRSRGLLMQTITNAHLGWSGYRQQDNRANWGLPTEDGRHSLFIPGGLLIPTYDSNGQLVRIRIRRKSLYKDNRYCILAGSSSSPMILSGGNKAVVIVESELDGLLVNQEAGDMVTVIALGSASIRPDIVTDGILQQADIILLALDADEAGYKASKQFWEPTYGAKVKRWPVPIGKDPGEAWQQGLDIRLWIEAGLADDCHSDIPVLSTENVMDATSIHETLEGMDNVFLFPVEWVKQFNETQLERLAIMTVDGGLSDTEAMKAMEVR